MRDFIDPGHLLIRIDGQFDFAKLAAPLEDRYCPDNGRPAIHLEVMVRTAPCVPSVQHIPLQGIEFRRCRGSRLPLVRFPHQR